LSTKIWVAVMAAITFVYLFLLAGRAFALLQSGEPVAQLMGLLILAFPVLAGWAVLIEIRFGLAAAKLAEAAVDITPELDIERRPSGRAEPESAQAAFDQASAALKADEENWALWFRLGEAYDACGDRRRARSAIRKAISLAPF
jgi:tetratricopeptide (TPR) repeat protein